MLWCTCQKVRRPIVDKWKKIQPLLSFNKLLPLLEWITNLLSQVDQSPAIFMVTSLSSAAKALVSNNLLKHPHVAILVAIPSSPSEIFRITYLMPQCSTSFHKVYHHLHYYLTAPPSCMLKELEYLKLWLIRCIVSSYWT